jgi:mono/diheme cytochrome c family protein
MPYRAGNDRLAFKPSRALGLTLIGLLLGLAGGRETSRADAQATPPAPGRAAPKPGPPVHGTPKGWTFSWPKGDPSKGRAVFERLECYSCHEVRGERFPAPSDAGRLGPELSGMAALHPPEFFAEAIINPGAVIEQGRGYAAADGSSKMPTYGDVLTIQETIDLVAYLRQLSPPGAPAKGVGPHRTH